MPAHPPSYVGHPLPLGEGGERSEPGEGIVATRPRCNTKSPSVMTGRMIYSAQVLDHFQHPRNAGEIERPTAVAEAVNPVCGDALQLWVVARDGKIADARFKAAGCVPSVACGSWLAEWLVGKKISYLREVSAELIEISLGGLPPASKHASALALDALRRLLDSLGP